MSWKPTQKILGILVDRGPLSEIEITDSKRSKRSYVITEKGVKILRYFYGARDLVEALTLYYPPCFRDIISSELMHL